MEELDEVMTDENEDSVLPRKQAKTDTFQAAFGDLKNSEFFKKDLAEPTAGPSKAKSTFTGLLVNPKQRGNPLLKYVRNVIWEYTDILPDYVMGPNVCALFLSIRYHQLNPDYIHERLKLLGSAYNLRVLLVQIDVPEPHHSLKHLTRICLLADLTLMLAWNAEDAGKIIETYKVYENKPPDMIMERANTDPSQKEHGLMNAEVYDVIFSRTFSPYFIPGEICNKILLKKKLSIHRKKVLIKYAFAPKNVDENVTLLDLHLSFEHCAKLSIMSALTTVRSVNKTDAITLMSTYGTIEGLLKATPNALSLCPGFGLQKAQRLHKVLHEPFLSETAPKPIEK